MKSYPEHIGIFEMSLRVPLLGVDKVGELCGVPEEEDGGVVEDPVPVALFGSQFYGETTGVTGRVSRTGLTADRGETDGGANLLSNLAEEGLGCDVAEIMSDFKVAMSSGTLGVYLREL